MRSIQYLIYMCALSGLFACQGLKPLAVQPLQAPPARYSPQDTVVTQPMSWRSLFTDPQLVALIDSALANNLDRKIAMANIRQSEAELVRARLQMAPQVQAMIAGGVERFGDYTMNGIGNFDLNRSENVPSDRRVPNPVTDLFVGFRASWEIDVWGRLKAQRVAAAERILSSLEGERWLSTNIVASVAAAYFELLALDAEVAVARENLVLQERAFEIISAQKEAGRATELAVQQFQAQIFNTRALTYLLQQRIVIAENALRLLLGRYNGTIPRGNALMDQNLPARLQVGLPSQLLLNRPDVRQAERSLEAAKADLTVARAAMLPNFTLTPYAGLQAFRPSVLFLPQSAALGLLGGVAAPVFNRRGLMAERSSRVAMQDAAWLRYQQSLVTAYTEVQNELQQYQNLQAAYPQKAAETAALNRAVEVSNDLYVAGYANYLEVITAQRGAIDAAIALQELRKNQFLNLINLYRALGGG